MKKFLFAVLLFFTALPVFSQSYNWYEKNGEAYHADSGGVNTGYWITWRNQILRADSLKFGKAGKQLVLANIGDTLVVNKTIKAPELRLSTSRLIPYVATTGELGFESGSFSAPVIETATLVISDADGIFSTSKFADLAGYKIFGTDITSMFAQLSQPNTFAEQQAYNDSVTFNHRVHENAAYIGINVSRIITCGNNNVNVITTLLSADLRGRYITTTGWKIGDKVRLICEAGITLEHDAAGAGRLFLAGATDVTVSDTWIAFEFCLAPDGNWYEIGARN